MASKVETSNTISLKGSVDIVTEFFLYSINNILYQRSIYPPESFRPVKQYGLTMMFTTDEQLNAYLNNIVKQLEVWLMEGTVQKLVLVVKGIETKETLERWVFECTCTSKDKSAKSEKPVKEIVSEIQALIRQITASITFLPLLNEPCCFDLLVYTDKENTTNVPQLWEDSDPCYIINAEEVKLRSFNTRIHRVDVAVSYKLDETAI
eukprot:gene1135-1204_t